MRLLVLIVLVVVAVWLIRRALAKASGGVAPQAKPSAEPGELIGCAHCGVLFPRSEARVAGDLSYCSAEHERLGPKG